MNSPSLNHRKESYVMPNLSPYQIIIIFYRLLLEK